MPDANSSSQSVSLTIEQAFQQAVAHHQAGRSQDAERLYRAILASQPAHSDANHNLGVLAIQFRQPMVALPHFRAALDANPNQGQYWLSYIDALIQSGQIDAARQALAQGRQLGLQGEALNALLRRLESLPGSEPGPEEMANLVALFSEKRYAEAVILAESMTVQFPRNGFGWKALGAIFKDIGRNEDSLAPTRYAAELLPNDAEAHFNLGSVLHKLGRLDETESSYRRALEIKPAYADAHNNLANTLKDMGRLEEAEASYRRALEIKPNFAIAHNNLGNTLFALGRLVESEASFRMALEVEPEFAEAYCGLGNTLKDLDRLDESECSCRRALEIKPDLAEAHNNLGNALFDLGRLVEAEVSYRQALDCNPNLLMAHSNLGATLKDLGRLVESEASSRRALEISPNCAPEYSNLLFLLAYFGMRSNERYLAEARGYELAVVPADVRAAARRKSFGRLKREGRRLRIGYVSGDFRAHPVSYFMERNFACHDRDRMEVFAYSTSARRDTVTEKMQGRAEHWHSLVGASDDAAVELISRHQIDVLVDLSGHTAFNRLGIFARRAAPVQCHYLGYFASTGLSEMDYWIGDPVLVPETHDGQYSEKVWRLPQVWISYTAPVATPDPVWRGDDGGKVCLGSFNNLGKLTPRTVELWAKVLQRVPNAYLLLKSGQLDDQRNRDRIYAAFQGHGIAQSRIELLGRTADLGAHMSLYGRLGIALDPVGGLSGSTTTCDALWMGVPVVTLNGNRYAERMTSSMLAGIGRAEWATANEDQYVEKVAQLAANVALRKKLRYTQRDAMRASPLCDAAGLTRALERAYEAMFDRWSAHHASSAGQALPG